MSKVAIKATGPSAGVPVVVDPAERGRWRPEDSYDFKPFVVPLRIRRGNNEYDLVEITVTQASAVRVRRSRISRMEVDYELKRLMMEFLGPNRAGPSEEPDPDLRIRPRPVAKEKTP